MEPTFSQTFLTMLVIIGPIWAICGAVASAIADDKNRKIAGILLGLLFGPFGIIAVLMMSKRRVCPECQLIIPDSAKRCGHCGADLAQSVKR